MTLAAFALRSYGAQNPAFRCVGRRTPPHQAGAVRAPVAQSPGTRCATSPAMALLALRMNRDHASRPRHRGKGVLRIQQRSQKYFIMVLAVTRIFKRIVQVPSASGWVVQGINVALFSRWLADTGEHIALLPVTGLAELTGRRSG